MTMAQVAAAAQQAERMAKQLRKEERRRRRLEERQRVLQEERERQQQQQTQQMLAATQSTNSVVSLGALNEAPHVVLGRAVLGQPAAPPSPTGSTRTSGDPSLFKVRLYVDTVSEQVPAIIAWETKNKMNVRLSQREPLFRAERGYYGAREEGRPYYAINVVEYRSMTRNLRGDTKTATMTLRVYYADELQSVKTRYDVNIKATLGDSGASFAALQTLSLHPKDSQVELGQRVFLGADPHHLLEGIAPSRRRRELPSLMFTPRVFSDISPPGANICWMNSGTRRLVQSMWGALRNQATADWTAYSAMLDAFNAEYYDAFQRAFGQGRHERLETRSRSGVQHL